LAGNQPQRGERIQLTAKAVGKYKKDFSPKGAKETTAARELARIHIKGITAFMANTKSLSKDERKKAKRTVRKKKKTESPLKPREYARGSAKRKVKKLVRGTAKR
jgi:hypothetical protein